MAEEKNFFTHGSRWIRADFHLHTRRDKEFKDTGSDQDFVARYVTALKQADIRVGVITNHNKFDREEFRSLRKAARKESIYLMPGVELSVKDGRNGIHTLVVFQEDWIDNKENTDHINSFLGLTFAGQSGYDNGNARSNHDLIETIREGYRIAFEAVLSPSEGNITFQVGKEPIHGKWQQITPYVGNKPVGRLVFGVKRTIWIEYIEVIPELRRQKIAEKMVGKLRKLYPGKEIYAIPTNEISEQMCDKLGIKNELLR